MSPVLTPRTRRILRVVAAILFASSTLIYTALWMAAVRYGARVELGYDATYLEKEQAQIVTRVQPDSPAERAGMRPGDRMVAIEGRRLQNRSFQEQAWSKHRPGDRIRIDLLHPGATAPVTVTAVFRRTASSSSDGGLTEYVAGEVRNSFPVPFVIVGLTVLFLRPDDRKVWLLAVMFAAFAATPGFPDRIDLFAPAFHSFTRVYQTVCLSLLAPLFCWFFAIFPARSPLERRVPWLKWAALAMGLALVPAGVGSGHARLPEPLPRLLGESLADEIVIWWMIAIFAVGLASLATNYFSARDAETTRKIRVIFWGIVAGLVPNLVAVGITDTTGMREPDWLATTLAIVAFLIPLSLAYAVVKHRVLEIPVLLRRSARYLLVQRGFTFVLALLSIGVTLGFATWLAPVLAPLVDLARPSGVAVGAVFGTMLLWGGSQVHRRVSERIDRAFFRRAYDTRLILEELADEARGATGRPELAGLLFRSIGAALHPRWLGIYFRESGREARMILMAGNRPAGRQVASEGGAEAPDAVQAEAVVPILGRDRRLLGSIVLGPPLSEEPYSAEDSRLLALVADRAALALENFALAEEIADRLESERRQAHEMAIAQEVQQKLLPQRQPRLESLDYAGACTQARVVGGDYYDFLDLAPGHVGFVLADISGKGIAAALLMANLQAMVRSHHAVALGDHEALLRSVNSLFHDATTSNRFATMFFAKYDDRSRELVYVNCGHNPPVLVRHDGTVEWLAPTAVALGFFDGWTCTSVTRRLDPGDLLVMYSDGITEAWSESGEEYGEARLLEVVRAERHLPASELVSRVVADVKRFSPGEQSDDWTLIAARVR